MGHCPGWLRLVQEVLSKTIYGSSGLMNKYTIAQIMEAWDTAYGEDMQAEYSGFLQKLQEENESKRIS